MTDTEYTRRLLSAWDCLRAADPRRARLRYDRTVARQLFLDGIPLDTVLAAIILATNRLAHRPKSQTPLPPPRSLAYILPVLDELRGVDPGYLNYLLGACPDLSAFR